MAFGALSFDAAAAFGVEISSDSPSAWGRFIYNNYAKGVDPFYAANPFFNQLAAILSVFFFAPAYIYLAIGFIRQDAKIRVPALIFAGTLLYAMALHIAYEFFNPNLELRVQNAARYLITSSFYIITPILLIFRLRKGF